MMMRTTCKTSLTLFLATLGFLLIPKMHIHSDEGMWLYTNLPKSQLQQRYNFQVEEDWAKHLQLASVRFNNGGSASFVSSDGLVITNHHVAADTLYKLSSESSNIYEKGFLALDNNQELKAPDLELNQLVSIEDVTDRVNAAVKNKDDAAEAAASRRAAIAEIEEASNKETGLRSNVVTLYGGGRYELYRFKKYTDVRLVWAPEAAAAFFGGDADNFEYPRYCLDVTLFRVYEDGKPAKIDHFLRMDPQGATDGDLIFVSGNPGRTRRIYTTDALAYQRDIAMPRTLDLLRRKEILLQQYALNGPEQDRRSRDDLFGIQNSRKAYSGMLAGLQDPAFFKSKLAYETELRKAIQSNPKLKSLDDAWAQIEKVLEKRREQGKQSGSLRSRLYTIAETILLLVQENQKPNTERLEEYRDSNRESLLQELYSPAPLYDDLERMELADELARFMEDRGGNDPLVLEMLAGQAPRERATAIVNATKLFDVEARKSLVDAGLSAVESSDDPLVKLAQILNPEYRRLEQINKEIGELEKQAYAKIAEAKFAIEGDSVYPDATFTLRLAFGAVKGYEEDGREIQSHTTLGGAFEHEAAHGKEDPWILPKSWHDTKSKIDLDTPFNFICTADIIGGNSGSPVVGRNGAMVGVIFDGNIHSLTADYYYSDKQARAVAVHIAGVLEVMRSVYGAGKLADAMGK